MSSIKNQSGFMECSFLSCSSDRSVGNNSFGEDEIGQSSFLSEDMSPETSKSAAKVEKGLKTSKENVYLSDDSSDEPSVGCNDSRTDSFIVSDSEDEEEPSFVSSKANDSLMSIDSPLPVRQQPLRFAKVDLNTPCRRKEKICPADSLERVKDRVYKQETNGSKLTFDPNSKSPKPFTPSANRQLLSKIKDEEEKKLLLELYPELNETSDTESLEESEHELAFEYVAAGSNKENASNTPNDRSSSSHSVCRSNNSAKSSPPSTNDDCDDTFERYLATLRGPKPHENDVTSEGSASVADDESFVVDDDVISVCSSASSSDELPEEYSDEEDKENVVAKKPPLLASLKAEFNSPSICRKPKKTTNDDDYFVDSLSLNYSGKRHSEAARFVAKGIKSKAMREELTEKLFELFKRRCFDGNFPMKYSAVTWNARLRKTAGLCRNNGKTGTSSIELSPKVCTTPDRLRDTLVHEMCHAATWIINRVPKVGHGPLWKKWASQCVRRCPSLPHIERCHAYEIEAKFVYECNGCGQLVKRHSKSLDTKIMICGRCRGTFELRSKGEKKTNKFAQFVKENYGLHKTKGISHKEVMVILSSKWKEASAAVSTSSVAASIDSVELDMSVLSIQED